jgi:hypothetical protein
MLGPAILHRHLKDGVPGFRLLRPTLTGDGVHARRSGDLVPALTPGALWTGRANQRGCSILALGTGSTPAGVLDRGTGGGGAPRQGPNEHVGQKKPKFSIRKRPT